MIDSKDYINIILNALANTINIIFAFLFDWDSSVVVAALFIQNFIFMIFVSMRNYRLFGKYYSKFDTRLKAWSPEYASVKSLIVILWIAFFFGHFLVYGMQDQKIFHLALASPDVHLLVISCTGYLAYQIYFYYKILPPLSIKRYKIDGKSTPVVLINSNRFVKTILQGIVSFLPLFFLVFVLQERSEYWLPGLLILTILFEIVIQSIEYSKREYII